MSAGYIYIMSNAAMPGLLKIGRTDRHPELRARELHTTGVPQPFVLEHHVLVSDSIAAEQMLHKWLQNKGIRMSANREFFAIDLANAVEALSLLTNQAGAQPDFTREHEFSQLAAALPEYDPRKHSHSDRDSIAERLHAIAWRGCPWAMKRAGELCLQVPPNGPAFKRYWREYLDLARQDALRHPIASSGGRERRHSVGREVADYLSICCDYRWLIEDDYSFIGSFLVDGDQHQYQGYIDSLQRLRLPDEVLRRAQEL